MKNFINIGIIGLGNIAEKMAATINGFSQNENIRLYAVASRSQKNADNFAQKYKVQKAYGSYQKLFLDKSVNLVYIATPHSHHYEQILQALEHNKHVLCEKAFTVNKQMAKKVFEIARQKKLLLCEAIWTRFMPSRNLINEVINLGIIGKITSLTANLGYNVAHKQRIYDPALAGGALLDIGLYPINFALIALGNNYTTIHSSVVLRKDTKVDSQETISIIYPDGKIASLFATTLANTNRRGSIFGNQGYIEIENINNPQKISVYNINHELIKTISVPSQISGYEYEVLACKKAIENGNIECPEMPANDTLQVLDIMDNLRAEWGLTYPFETKTPHTS